MMQDENSFSITGKFLSVISEETSQNNTYYIHFEIASTHIFGNNEKTNYVTIKAFNGLANWLIRTIAPHKPNSVRLRIEGTILQYKQECQLIAKEISII